VSGNLRQQAIRAVPRRFAKEHGAKTQAAAGGFLNNAHAFNGTVAVLGALGTRKGLSKLLDQSIVPAFNAA
jgi:hypothetical protein